MTSLALRLSASALAIVGITMLTSPASVAQIINKQICQQIIPGSPSRSASCTEPTPSNCIPGLTDCGFWYGVANFRTNYQEYSYGYCKDTNLGVSCQVQQQELCLEWDAYNVRQTNPVICISYLCQGQLVTTGCYNGP